MHVFLCIFFLLLLINSATCFSINQTFDRFERAVGHDEAYIQQIYYNHIKCAQTDWACREECRLEFADRITGLCIRPSPTQTCFGIPIRYNFTFESPNILTELPKYEVLSKFPRCWSELGPLLCAVAYRPCSNRTYFEVSMDKAGKMELWQVFRKDMCHRAVKSCSFLFDSSLWPDFVNCSDTIEKKDGRRIFSNGSCRMNYDKEPSEMESKQCLWPLVNGVKHKKPMSQPLIDDCYMSCRSPLISSKWLYDGFKSSVFFFSVTIASASLLCTLYLFTFSFLYNHDLSTYSLTHALLSASVHWFMWSTSYFEELAQRAVCFYWLRRDAMILRSFLDWCNIQFWILRASMLAGYFWLLTAFVIHFGHPKLNCSQAGKWQKKNLDLRSFSLLNYFLASFIATIGLWINSVETDGATGICYLGLQTVGSATQLYIPFLFAFIIFSLLIAYMRYWNKGHLTSEILDDFKRKDQVGLMEKQVVGKSISMNSDFDRNGYFRMTKSWRNLLFGVTVGSQFFAALVLFYSFSISTVSERDTVLNSVRCSLRKTIIEGQTEWLRGLVRDNTMDVFSRRESLGNSFLSAVGCDLPTDMDDRLFYTFLVHLFFPSLPYLTIVVYVLSGFCGYGLTDVEKVRDKINPFVLVKYCDFASASQKEPSDIKQIPDTFNSVQTGQLSEASPNCEPNDPLKSSEEQESVDKFPSDVESRRLDVLQKSRERRQRQLNHGPLFSAAVNSSISPTVLSAYQNGLIEGRWRERCVTYEKHIKALSANLRVADHEIRRLAGLDVWKGEQKLLSSSGNNISSDGIENHCRLTSSTQFESCHDNFSVNQKHNVSRDFAGGGDHDSEAETSLKCQTFFGGSSTRKALDEIAEGNEDHDSSKDSDSFDSDEEDSEEERIYNEKMMQLQQDKNS